MNHSFYLPKIEIRTSLNKGVKKYIIKGYATTKGNPYSYEKVSNSKGEPVKSFKEFFTDKGIENIKRKAKKEKIWVDFGHHTSFGMNLDRALSDVESSTGINLKEEKDYVKTAFSVGDIPMFKLEELEIDDKGIFVEIQGNPFYSGYSEEHKGRFESTWNSLENGYINGLSLNLKVTDTTPINETLRAINDVDVYGISLLSGASNDQADITEVAVRCCINRGEKKCQNRMMKKLML